MGFEAMTLFSQCSLTVQLSYRLARPNHTYINQGKATDLMKSLTQTDRCTSYICSIMNSYQYMYNVPFEILPPTLEGRYFSSHDSCSTLRFMPTYTWNIDIHSPCLSFPTVKWSVMWLTINPPYCSRILFTRVCVLCYATHTWWGPKTWWEYIQPHLPAVGLLKKSRPPRAKYKPASWQNGPP